MAEMTKICGWCGFLMESGGPEVSHGICSDCLKVWKADAQETVERYREIEKGKEKEWENVSCT